MQNVAGLFPVSYWVKDDLCTTYSVAFHEFRTTVVISYVYWNEITYTFFVQYTLRYFTSVLQTNDKIAANLQEQS